MPWKHRLLLFALAPCALGAVADPPPVASEEDRVKRYMRLVDDIRDFERFSNAEMNDLIFAGLYSDNPTVVDLTIAALGVESRYRDFRGGDYTPEFRQMIGKRQRDIARVPGIRDFLIGYAKARLAEHGWRALDQLTVDYYEKNPWTQAFGMLPTYFPGDPDVRLLLRESYARPDAADRQHGLMNLLNDGLYTDAAADELRVEQLANPNPTWAGAAARGLAMSGTEAGLMAMANIVGRRQDALGEIATAMGMYGAEASPRLGGLFNAPGTAPQGVEDTVSRVIAQVRRLADTDFAILWNTGRRTAGTANAGAATAQPAGRGNGTPPDALELDPDGVPVVTNWRGRKEPLDFALQLYDAFHESQVLDIVFAGLASGDPEIAERTVAAVGSYAHVVAQRDWPGYAPERGEWLVKTMDTRTRRLDKVPGFKGLLLAYARGEMTPARCRERAARRDAEWPTWMLAVATLAVYFPGNADVRSLVLDMGRCLDAAEAGQSILPLLAVGRFRGEAVENWWVGKLTHPDPVEAGWAAQGLCWTLTDTGLAALAEHLLRTDEALADIVDAIACHGVRAVPHLPALRSLTTPRQLSEATFERIESATRKVTQLAALAQAEEVAPNAEDG